VVADRLDGRTLCDDRRLQVSELQGLLALPAELPDTVVPPEEPPSAGRLPQEPRRRSHLAHLWKWLGENHEQVTIFFALVAGAYVLIEYQSKEHEETVKRSLEFQARYGQKEILAARIKLDGYLLSEQYKQDIAAAAAKDANGKMTEVIRKRGLDSNVYILADFFDQVTTCVEKDLCDKKTACAIFKGPIVGLRNNYHGLFEDWKKTWGENFAAKSSGYFEKNCPAK
jgi:effector-binding domain-containing protein